MVKTMRALPVLFALLSITGCSPRPDFWPPNNTGGGSGESGGDGDGDGGSSGDGDTDSSSGDGDGDTGSSCDGVEVDGACILSCENEGEVRCEEECIDPTTSADFCGATEACQDVGSACASDESCVLGACRSWGMEEDLGPFMEGFSNGRGFALVIDKEGNTTLAHNAGTRNGPLKATMRPAGGDWLSSHTLDDEVYNHNYAYPVLAVDGDGNVLAIWPSGSFSAGHGWARYRAQTGSWGSSAAFDLGDFASPSAVLAAPNGDVFIGYDNGVYGASTEAWTRRFGFEADGWFNAVRLDKNGAEEAGLGTLIVDADSNVTATWSERVSDTEVVARASLWNAADEEWSASEDLGDSPYADQTGAADADGNVALVFCYRTTGGQIVPHNYDSAQGSWSNDPALVDDSNAFNDNCMVASNAAGDMMLSLEQATPAGRHILVSRRNPITRTWQGVTDIMDDSSYPAIGMDAAGNAWVVAYRGDDDGSELVARRYDAALQVWEDEITIASASAPEMLSQPQLAVSASGSAVVVWSFQEDSSSPSTLSARSYE